MPAYLPARGARFGMPANLNVRQYPLHKWALPLPTVAGTRFHVLHKLLDHHAVLSQLTLTRHRTLVRVVYIRHDYFYFV